MSRYAPAAILSIVAISAVHAADRPSGPATPGVLTGLSIANFNGSTQDSIEALATDSTGNIYITGTTWSPKFSAQNAEQPNFGESTVLRSTNLGSTWTSAGLPAPNISVVVPDPVDPQTLFAASPLAIFKSTNTGQTWTQVYAFNPRYGTAPQLVIDPANHLHLVALTPYVSTAVRSLDGGITWTPGGPTCTASSCSGTLLADPTGSGTLVLTSGYISHDWGLTFQSFGPTGGQGGPSAAAFDPSHPGWIYVGKSAGASGTLWLTTDYGVTWTSKASPEQNFSDILYLAVDPDQPSTLVAADADAYYLSTNGAASWTKQASTSSFFAETNNPFFLIHHTCSPTDGMFAINGALAFSPDFGITWQTPRLTRVSSVAAGPNCTFYASRTSTSDAFVAKITPTGDTLWATYLGGSDADTPIAMALDPQGNVYVTGNTTSPDFPATVPALGPSAGNSIFLTKLSPTGALLYSLTLGGTASNSVYALAVDPNQNAYLVGATNSSDFPVTSGTLDTTLSAGSYAGLLAKISPTPALAYATYLGTVTPGAIFVDATQNPIIGGWGVLPGASSSTPSTVLAKLDHAASQILTVANLPVTPSNMGAAVTSIATDPQGNLVAFGQGAQSSQVATPGAYSSPPAPACLLDFDQPQGGDAFVTKLSASTWQTIYTAVLTAPCGVRTNSMVLDNTGAPVLALYSNSGMPLRRPLVGGATCGLTSSAIAKLSANGSTLPFGTYLDSCGLPGIALAADGSIYAGSERPGGGTMVLHLANPNPAAISIDQISNAFSGDSSAVAPGGLYAINTSNLNPPSTNLGLNPTADLPAQLNGIQVKFDGQPAAILSTAPGQIIVAAPLPTSARPGAIEKNHTATPAMTSIQLFANGASSNQVWIPITKSRPGLLTLNFPNLVNSSQGPDGNIRNQDGTQNSPTNPASAGSTITLFLTGAGATDPPVSPGSIATSLGTTPITPLFSSWEISGPGPGQSALPEPVTSVPGFVSSMFQIQIQVPANIQNLPGTDLGNGVRRVQVGLELGVLVEPISPLASNLIFLYVN